MQLRRITPEDVEQINSWLEYRNLPLIKDKQPGVGLIVDGVAAAYLFQTDGYIAYIDSLFTNRKSTVEERDRAMRMIFNELFKIGLELGYSFVCGYVTQESLAIRAKQLGLEVHSDPHYMIYKEIE